MIVNQWFISSLKMVVKYKIKLKIDIYYFNINIENI